MTSDNDRLIGQEVEARCNKCKLDTLHTVTSVKDGKIHKVMCNICNGYHVYRNPKEGPSTMATKIKKTTKKRTGGRRKNWNTAITTITEEDIVDYATSDDFSDATAIRHKRFGVGIITKIHDTKKIEVLFEEGSKLLGQNVVFADE